MFNFSDEIVLLEGIIEELKANNLDGSNDKMIEFNEEVLETTKMLNGINFETESIISKEINDYMKSVN